jgi:hypothetical protein
MKNLRKIIILFIFIFFTGIIISVISINKTLHKKSSTETVESYKDTLILLKYKKETV